MKLIVIYGPPAVGKLTVGKELAKLTGYKLFHNHLAIDLVHEIYDWGNPSFFTLVHTIRIAVVESAVKSETSLILTFFYTGAEREKTFFKRIKELVTTSGGSVLFVHMTAPIEVLRERVISQSRKQFGKLTTEDSLTKTLETNKDATYDVNNQLVLDATSMGPQEMAQAIEKTAI